MAGPHHTEGGPWGCIFPATHGFPEGCGHPFKEDTRVSYYHCEAHGSTVRGSLDTVYVTLLHQSFHYHRRARFCADHAAEFLEDAGAGFRPAQIELSDEDSLECDACKRLVTFTRELSPCFVTAYVGKEARRDYFARWCEQCVPALASRLKLTLRAA